MNQWLQFLVGFCTILYRVIEHLVLCVIPKSRRFKNVSKETVLITGGGSGMGRSMALIFASLGSKVVVWDVNKQGNEETCRMVTEKGGYIRGYVCDVSNRDEIYATARRVKNDVGVVTILVNNAGIVVGKKLLELQDENIEKIFKINTISHFYTCKAFLPDMMAVNSGHVVNIASVVGQVGCEKLTDYCATKFSVVGFGESLKAELRASGYNGIHVSTVCPSLVNTGLFAGLSTGLIPPLETDTAAEKIVEAVLVNDTLTYLPWYLSFIVMYKAILPTEGFVALTEMLGGKGAMDNFQGKLVNNNLKPGVIKGVN